MSPLMQNIEPETRSPESADTQNVIHVCVGVIERFNSDSGKTEVLIAKRPDHLHQGGLWEFPGGKVETGETLLEALDRELHEELDIRVCCEPLVNEQFTESNRPLIQIRHAYPDKTVLLDVWKVNRFEGQAFGKEGQLVRWVPLDELSSYSFPQANLPIITACLLPNRYFITPAYPSLLIAEQALLKAMEQGAQLIYFRQPQLDSQNYMNWVDVLISRHPQLRSILMHQQLPELESQQAAGVHLSFRAAEALRTRPVEKHLWFAVSCHTEAELAHAIHLEADFVTLSPVLQTQTHPEQAGMGWAQFERLVRNARLPVFGLGGLSAGHESKLAECGAQGLAGISFWQ
jgi:8-oxo-dGTP diphosphatase